MCIFHLNRASFDLAVMRRACEHRDAPGALQGMTEASMERSAASVGVSEAGFKSFEEVDFNTEGLTHRYSWPGGSPDAAAADFPDFALPPSQVP